MWLHSFNWAAVFQPRKPDTGLVVERAAKELQLGRGLSTAETKSAQQSFDDLGKLQLGRGLSTAETFNSF